MNIAQMPSTEGGNIFLTMELPTPFPPTMMEFAHSTRLQDGLVELYYDYVGRMVARVFNEGQRNPSLEVVSCPVLTVEPAQFVLCISWKSTELAIMINGTLVASTDRSAVLPAAYKIQKRNNPLIDFSAENDLAVKKRRDKLAGHGGTPKKPGWSRAGKDEIFKALATDLRQLEDLLSLMKNGATHHAVGMSAIIRKMIATGQPLALVQLSAAYIDEPLIIYTGPDPRSKPPTEIPVEFGIHLSASYELSKYRNPIDIDVWLDTPAGQIGKDHFTQRQLIKKLGDTRGAHFDLDVYPPIPAMEGSRSKSAGGTFDLLFQYIGSMGFMTFQLGLQVHRKGPFKSE